MNQRELWIRMTLLEVAIADQLTAIKELRSPYSGCPLLNNRLNQMSDRLSTALYGKPASPQLPHFVKSANH